MSRSIPAILAVSAFLTAGPAFAKCSDDVDALSSQLRRDTAFQQRPNGRSVEESAYERLFGAARIFALSGLEQRCQAVLGGIREMAEKDRADVSTIKTGVSGNPSKNMNRSR